MAKRDRWVVVGVAVALYLTWLVIYLHTLDLHGRNFDYENFIFDADGTRVIKVVTSPGWALSTERHPLYVAMLQPLGLALDWFVGDPIESSLAVTAALAALAIPCALVLFRRTAGGLLDGVLWTTVFAASGAFWLFAAMPETFAINVATIVIGYLLQLTPDGAPLSPRRFRRRFALHVAFGTLATGLTLTNSVYAFFSVCSLTWKHRPDTHARRFVVARVALYVAAVTLLIGVLSRVHNAVYPQTHELTGPGGYAEVIQGDQRFVVTDDELAWLGVEARTFFGSSIVAPRAEMTEVLQVNSRLWSVPGKWHILQFSLSSAWSYWVCAGFGLALCVALAIRSRGTPPDSTRRWRPEIAMALAGIGFNLVLHSFYRGIGEPLMYATHVVFPILFLLSLLYGRSALPGKRALLFVFTCGLIATNATFLGDVNDNLRNADPRPFRLPPEGGVLGGSAARSRPAPTTTDKGRAARAQREDMVAQVHREAPSTEAWVGPATVLMDRLAAAATSSADRGCFVVTGCIATLTFPSDGAYRSAIIVWRRDPDVKAWTAGTRFSSCEIRSDGSAVVAVVLRRPT